MSGGVEKGARVLRSGGGLKPVLPGIRRRARVARNRLSGRGRYLPGLVSVVVPAYGVEAYIGECLDSLCAQEYEQVEIIVVDDGSPDASAEIARRKSLEDPRIRVVHRPNGGLSAARNTGVEHAVGEFLTFVDADDTVSRRVFSAPVQSLAVSNSDFAVTNYDRLGKDGKLTSAAKWIQRAHQTRRIGTTVEEFPDAMVNAVAWSRVWRRTFWDAAGLSFPEGRLYEDQPVSMAGFAKAQAFDFLPAIGVHWRIRGDGSSISQAAASVRNLADHNEAVRTSLAAMRNSDRPDAALRRKLQLLVNNMPFFVRHIGYAGDEFWRHLQEGIRELVDGIERDVYVHEVPALDKVLYEMVLTDRRDHATEIIERYQRDIRRYPTRVSDDGVHVVLPYLDQVSEETTTISDQELRLEHRLEHVTWQPDGTLRLEGWAYVAGINLAEHEQSLSLALMGEGGFRRELEVTKKNQARANLPGHDYCDYSPGGFVAVLDASDLADGDYRFELTVGVAGIMRRSEVDQPSVVGSAGVSHSWVLPEGRAMVARHGKRRVAGAVNPLHLKVTSRAAWVRVASWDGDVLEIDFVADDPQSVQLAHIDRPDAFASAVPVEIESGWRVRLDLSGLSEQLAGLSATELRRPLRVRVGGSDGTTPLLAPSGVTHSPGVAGVGNQGPHALTRARTGELEVFDWLPAATDFELTDDLLRVNVAHAGVLPANPVMRGTVTEVPGVVEPGGTPTRSTLLFELTRTSWQRDGLALPADRYLIGFSADPEAGAASQQDELNWVPLMIASDLLDRLPTDRTGQRHRVRTNAASSVPPTLVVNLTAPLGDDERGRYNQRRLKDEARTGHAGDDSVFFRTLYGEVTNCNPLGVHEELRRRGAQLSLLWSIADRSVPVPEGGIGLVEGTREWHHALARSRYQMVNVHQLDWFAKPSGQTMIQTMHGYPYKSMGHEWWDKGDFPPHQIASYDRRAREWDFFVSPAGYATPLLRAAFLDPAGAGAEVLEIGYPRNDVLLSPEGPEIRRRARELLGISENATVVLYAPTFRDYMSADDMTARRVDFLDAGLVTSELDDVVVLLRGHAFHSRAKDGRPRSTATVIDVTDHPDINDLILASDVAVLDYSSLRFDYGVTDKPMIFLVPDLAKYHQGRGGVIAYEPTAPGPHVTSTEEVVSWLADIPRLRDDYVGARKRFREDYTDKEDGHASARLVEAVFVPRGDALTSAAEDQGRE